MPGIEVSIFITSFNSQNNPTRYVVLYWSPERIQGVLMFREGNNLSRFTHIGMGQWMGLEPGLWMAELGPSSKSQWPNLTPALVISFLNT